MNEKNKKILAAIGVVLLLFSISYILITKPKEKPKNVSNDTKATAEVQTTKTTKTLSELKQELSESEKREESLLSELKKTNEEIATKNDIQSIDPLLVKRDSLIQSISYEDDYQSKIKLEIEAGQ